MQKVDLQQIDSNTSNSVKISISKAFIDTIFKKQFPILELPLHLREPTVKNPIRVYKMIFM